MPVTAYECEQCSYPYDVPDGYSSAISRSYGSPEKVVVYVYETHFVLPWLTDGPWYFAHCCEDGIDKTQEAVDLYPEHFLGKL